MNFSVPKFPLAHIMDVMLNWLTAHIAFITQAISHVISAAIDGIVQGLLFLPPWVLIIVVAVLAWRAAGVRVAIGSLAGLLFLWDLRLWAPTVETFTLVLISTLVAVAIGLPLGILAALNKRVSKVVMPILDFMQTMPAFVYLIPAILFFGLGAVPAVVATLIFAIPPAIRLTDLGIRQVDNEVIEAATAFGSTPNQILVKVQLPMAIATIMAGVNQMIMLALSMVVIAGMIGAEGLGAVVLRGIDRLNVGLGFEGGLSIVLLAIFLDRLTEALGRRTPGQKVRASE